MGKTQRKPRTNQFRVKHGVLPPSAQVLHFLPAQWEEFIEAAVRLPILESGQKYAYVHLFAGPNDKGRDVEARLIPERVENQWDLYQAKHYETRLGPADFFPELAKFFTHLLKGSYVRPRFYWLCAPRGLGSDLADLFADKPVFLERFIADWKAGKTGMTGRSAELTPEMEKVIRAFGFENIKECQLRDLIAWHELDRAAHYKLFGIAAERGDDPDAPPMPTSEEDAYVQALVGVYSEHSGQSHSVDSVLQSDEYAEHFQDQRTTFYCAEGLKTFSRDLYGEHEFDNLLDMVQKGVRPVVNSPKYTKGLDRLQAGIDSAQTLKVNDSVLAPRLRPGDLPGTCHHLVNQKKLKWVK
jgi:hypothetical protein